MYLYWTDHKNISFKTPLTCIWHMYTEKGLSKYFFNTQFHFMLLGTSHGRVFSGVPSSILVFSKFEFLKTTRDSSISTRQCIDVPSTGRVKGTSRVKSSFTRFYSTKGRVKYPLKIRVLKLGFLKTNLDSILDSTRNLQDC